MNRLDDDDDVDLTKVESARARERNPGPGKTICEGRLCSTSKTSPANDEKKHASDQDRARLERQEREDTEREQRYQKKMRESKAKRDALRKHMPPFSIFMPDYLKEAQKTKRGLKRSDVEAWIETEYPGHEILGFTGANHEQFQFSEVGPVPAGATFVKISGLPRSGAVVHGTGDDGFVETHKVGGYQRQETPVKRSKSEGSSRSKSKSKKGKKKTKGKGKRAASEEIHYSVKRGGHLDPNDLEVQKAMDDVRKSIVDEPDLWKSAMEELNAKKASRQETCKKAAGCGGSKVLDTADSSFSEQEEEGVSSQHDQHEDTDGESEEEKVDGRLDADTGFKLDAEELQHAHHEHEEDAAVRIQANACANFESNVDGVVDDARMKDSRERAGRELERSAQDRRAAMAKERMMQNREPDGSMTLMLPQHLTLEIGNVRNWVNGQFSGHEIVAFLDGYQQHIVDDQLNPITTRVPERARMVKIEKDQSAHEQEVADRHEESRGEPGKLQQTSPDQAYGFSFRKSELLRDPVSEETLREMRARGYSDGQIEIFKAQICNLGDSRVHTLTDCDDSLADSSKRHRTEKKPSDMSQERREQQSTRPITEMVKASQSQSPDVTMKASPSSGFTFSTLHRLPDHVADISEVESFVANAFPGCKIAGFIDDSASDILDYHGNAIVNRLPAAAVSVKVSASPTGAGAVNELFRRIGMNQNSYQSEHTKLSQFAQFRHLLPTDPEARKAAMDSYLAGVRKGFNGEWAELSQQFEETTMPSASDRNSQRVTEENEVDDSVVASVVQICETRDTPGCEQFNKRMADARQAEEYYLGLQDTPEKVEELDRIIQAHKADKKKEKRRKKRKEREGWRTGSTVSEEEVARAFQPSGNHPLESPYTPEQLQLLHEDPSLRFLVANENGPAILAGIVEANMRSRKQHEQQRISPSPSPSTTASATLDGAVDDCQPLLRDGAGNHHEIVTLTDDDGTGSGMRGALARSRRRYEQPSEHLTTRHPAGRPSGISPELSAWQDSSAHSSSFVGRDTQAYNMLKKNEILILGFQVPIFYFDFDF